MSVSPRTPRTRSLLSVCALLLLGATGFSQIDALLAPVKAAPAEHAKIVRSVAVEGPRGGQPDVRPGDTGNSLSADALLIELEKQLGEHFATDGELKLAMLRGWQPLALPAQDWSLIVTEWPAGGIASTFFVRAKVLSGGETVLDAQFPLRAQLFQEVWLAANRIDRGQPLDRTLLATQKVDVIRERGTLLPASIDPALLEAVATIPAGRALNRRDVIARPLIRKGQVVEAIAQQGFLAVRMKALALESGAVGDLIKLRNLESRKDFNGQILDESKVQVHF